MNESGRQGRAEQSSGDRQQGLDCLVCEGQGGHINKLFGSDERMSSRAFLVQ
jgi:hypothetical protein